MNSLNTAMKRRPVIAAVGVLLASITGYALIDKLFSLMPAGLLFSTLQQLSTLLFTVLMVCACGYSKLYRQRGFFRTLRVGMVHLLLYLLSLSSNLFLAFATPGTQWVPLGEMLFGALMLFAIGFNEESIYRGVITNLLAEKGMHTRRDVFKVVFLSGALFGAAHLRNVAFGVSLGSVLFQSLSAFAIGSLLCVCYLRGGSLWAVIFLHALQDASGLFSYLFLEGADISTTLNTISPLALLPCALFLLLTLALLRKNGWREIIDRHAAA